MRESRAGTQDEKRGKKGGGGFAGGIAAKGEEVGMVIGPGRRHLRFLSVVREVSGLLSSLLHGSESV